MALGLLTALLFGLTACGSAVNTHIPTAIFPSPTGTPVSTQIEAEADVKHNPQNPAPSGLADRSTDYVGLWQDSETPSSIYARRLALNADGTFYFTQSEMDAVTNERFRYGTWIINGGTITLNIEERLFWAGDETIADPIYGSKLADYEIVCAPITETLEYELGEVELDAGTGDITSFLLGETQYWYLSAETDLLKKEYIDTSIRATKLESCSKPPRGCWETTDRGGEEDGILRVSETINGQATSVRADWFCIEFDDKGNYALWERDYNAGIWTANRQIGKAYISGDYLFLIEHTMRFYEGATFETISQLDESVAPHHPCGIYALNALDEYDLWLWMNGYKTLTNFVGKADRPPWSAAMAEDSISVPLENERR